MTATGSDDHVFDAYANGKDGEPGRSIPPLGQKAQGADPSACWAPAVWLSAPPAASTLFITFIGRIDTIKKLPSSLSAVP